MTVNLLVGNTPWSTVNAGIYSHSDCAGVMLVMNFKEDLRSSCGKFMLILYAGVM